MNAESEKTRAMMTRVNPEWESRARELAEKGTKQSVANVMLFGESANTNSAKLLWGIWDKVKKSGIPTDSPAPVPASPAPVPVPASTAVSVAAEAAMESLPAFMVQAGALLGIGTAVSFRSAYNAGTLQNWIASLTEGQRSDFYRIIRVENPEEVRKLEKQVREAVQLIRNSGKRFGVWVEDTRSTFGASPEVQDAETLKEALMLAPRSNLLDVVHGNEQEPEMEAELAPEAETEMETFDYLSAYGLDD